MGRLEHGSMSEAELSWAEPIQCRSCHYPAGEGGEFCLNCGTPLVFFSLTGLKHWLSFFGRMTVYGALILCGLYLCYKVSPVLLAFPLLCVFSQK